MKVFFTVAIVLQLLAQSMFSIHSESINLLEPIDFIHWTLLLGMVFFIPFTLNFLKGVYGKIGIPLTMIGIITSIGMCAIDLVLWSLRGDVEERNELVLKLMEEPSIWPVFFTIGPAFLFIGMSIQVLGYIKDFFMPVIVTLVGAVLVAIGGLIYPELRLVFMLGYFLFAIGLSSIVFQN